VRWLPASVCVAAAAFAGWARVAGWGWFLVLAVVLAGLAVGGDYAK
jgi:hypothetical protein